MCHPLCSPTQTLSCHPYWNDHLVSPSHCHQVALEMTWVGGHWMTKECQAKVLWSECPWVEWQDPTLLPGRKDHWFFEWLSAGCHIFLYNLLPTDSFPRVIHGNCTAFLPCALKGAEVSNIQQLEAVWGVCSVLCSSGMLDLTWVRWLWPRCFACCMQSFCFRYSVRALGSWAYEWYSVTRAWEISQAYKVVWGGSVCSVTSARLTQELRPKVQVHYWYRLNSTMSYRKESVAILTKEIGFWTPLMLLLVVWVAQRCILYKRNNKIVSQHQIDIIQDKQWDHIVMPDPYHTRHEDHRLNW